MDRRHPHRHHPEIKQNAVSTHIKIETRAHGPYWVSGAPELKVRETGIGVEGVPDHYIDRRRFALITAGISLCRRGHSKNKPCCDGGHVAAHFEGPETARRLPYEKGADVQTGPVATLTDQQDLCAFARFCDGGGKIWQRVESSLTP